MEKIVIAIIDDEKSYFELFNANYHVIERILGDTVEFKSYLFDGEDPEELSKFINDMSQIDIVLVDYDMPQFNGIEVIMQAHEHIDPTRIMASPTFLLNTKFWSSSEMVIKMMKNGAADCVTFDKYNFEALGHFVEEHIVDKKREKATIKSYEALTAAGMIL